MTDPVPTPETADDPAAIARGVMRGVDRAVLATSLEGWPYASLVLVAQDDDGTPLLLLSDLAEHARNLRREPRASLLFDGTSGLDEPLTGPRVTVLGEARLGEARLGAVEGGSEPGDEARRRERFLARHPSARRYAGFGDFRLWRLAVTRAHLVAGFGRIHWIEGSRLLAPAGPSSA